MLSSAALLLFRSRLIAENAPRPSLASDQALGRLRGQETVATLRQWVPNHLLGAGDHGVSGYRLPHTVARGASSLGLDPTSLAASAAFLLAGMAIVAVQKHSLLELAQALLSAVVEEVKDVYHAVEPVIGPVAGAVVNSVAKVAHSVVQKVDHVLSRTGDWLYDKLHSGQPKHYLPSGDSHPIAPRSAADEIRQQQSNQVPPSEANQPPKQKSQAQSPGGSSEGPREATEAEAKQRQVATPAEAQGPEASSSTFVPAEVKAPQVGESGGLDIIGRIRRWITEKEEEVHTDTQGRPSPSYTGKAAIPPKIKPTIVHPGHALSGGQATIGAIIEKAAELVGAPADVMLIFAGMESDFNPSAGAGTSSAKGLFQFIRSTWAIMVRRYGQKYGIGIGDIMDPFANAVMAALLMKESMVQLKSLGISSPNAVDLYLVHFLGDVAPFYANLDKPGYQIYPKAASSNPSVFRDKSGRPRTLREVYQYFAARMANVSAGLSASRTQIEVQYQRLESVNWSATPEMATAVGTARNVARQEEVQLPTHRKVAIEDGHVTADKSAYFG